MFLANTNHTMAQINLKDFRKRNGISQQVLADYLGIGQGFVSQMEKGTRPIPKQVMDKIKENPEWIVEFDDDLRPGKKNMIPLYDDAATIGGNNEMVANVDDQSRAMEYIDAGDWFAGATSAIYHYGDSMVEYPSGCILALKRVVDSRLILNGATYVIETDEFRITKQVQDDGDCILAYSSNRETYPDGRLIHSPIRIPKDAIRHMDLVLGCVVKHYSNGPIRIK